MVVQPHILVIRHEECSSLGMLKTAVKQAEIPFRYLDTYAGETLDEPIENYSHIVVLGGAVSAYEDEEYPFLRYEFQLIEKAIAQEIPILGICLGSQILAKILGAKVYRGKSGREAGWCELQLTCDGTNDPLLHDFPNRFRVFQSHQDTFDIPADCIHLAKSDIYPNQAFRYRDFVWAIQFHPEIDENVLLDCADVIEQELIDSKISDTTVEQMIELAKLHSPAVAPLADSLMGNFIQVHR
ncbi:type 1 glutamine amidotransferase [Scytonema millei]|uniref:Type 1 glutamine amidotransferase n=1 Tax=Scytonema millei VB511283 TaxID=1245923 RepID=A0A9X5I3T3_9CYAN|nr:type 1 glutamine amidotransferase [Scytonema millei]NHC33884.1 type 1 glutamine amidotransferase [Scytonema millei VB511283]